MMGMMGMLPMIGKMAGSGSAVVGMVVHLAISAFLGTVFGAVFGPWASGRARGLAAGMLYGFLWWVLGPLTLMPLFLGMGWGVNWNPGAVAGQLPSLMGHLIYGAALGFSYAVLSARSASTVLKPKGARV
jgi:uncharacterized membrane protein YagU involved in acid resistance